MLHHVARHSVQRGTASDEVVNEVRRLACWRVVLATAGMTQAAGEQLEFQAGRIVVVQLGPHVDRTAGAACLRSLHVEDAIEVAQHEEGRAALRRLVDPVLQRPDLRRDVGKARLLAGEAGVQPGLPVERAGATIQASVWFRFAEAQVQLREMKISADQHDSVLTLLCLPRASDFWPPSRPED